MTERPSRIAVVGLGYVGLPLAVAFGRVLPVLGFDVDPSRAAELTDGHDRNGEATPEALRSADLTLSSDPDDLQEADFFIVAVPTPVDEERSPDLAHLESASRLVARALKAQASQAGVLKKSTIVYESTVYPGCTEEVCLPIVEAESGLRAGRDFEIGYSPERMNPGDSEHGLERVIKIVSGGTPEALDSIAQTYSLVATAGVYRAPDIRTAEAAKVIENVQRDLNIALMNELSMLFHRLDLDTREVLKAAGTKWNFLSFQPGLVGGHCIPVDPYYLTYKAEQVGHRPEVILAGRRMNDQIASYIADETVALLEHGDGSVQDARVLMLGASFKEGVSDVRNSQAIQLAHELERHGAAVFVHDPLVDAEALRRLDVTVVEDPFVGDGRFDAVVLAVPHPQFRERPTGDYVALLDHARGALVDVKGVLPWEPDGAPGVQYWAL